MGVTLMLLASFSYMPRTLTVHPEGTLMVTPVLRTLLVLFAMKASLVRGQRVYR